MSTKHTPGPWKRGGLYGTMVYVGGDLLDEDSRCICDTLTGGSDLDAENAANARLIAAAPEMFEALSEIVEGESRKARAALLKARCG